MLDAAGLARSLFNHLWQACGQWQQQVPPAARAPQRQWLVSAHAIRNARRRMEDRHVCLPAFNLLLGLEVSGARGGRGPWCPAGPPARAPSKWDAHRCHKHLPGTGWPGSSSPPSWAGEARDPPTRPPACRAAPHPPPQSRLGPLPLSTRPHNQARAEAEAPEGRPPQDPPPPARPVWWQGCASPSARGSQAVTPPRTPGQDSVERAYFAVFDGHGGADAARYASVQVHAVAARRPELATDPAEALRAAFRCTDEMFLRKARREVSADWGCQDGPSLLPRQACGWNPRGALSSRGCAGLMGRAARLSRYQGRRDDRCGALPCGSQEETPPHARAMREACRVGQGTKDSLAPVGRHCGKLRIGWFD